MVVPSGMCVGWVEDGVPDHREEKSAVELHVQDGFPDLNSFHSSPLAHLWTTAPSQLMQWLLF